MQDPEDHVGPGEGHRQAFTGAGEMAVEYQGIEDRRLFVQVIIIVRH